ncbi:hypothetical protein FRB90_004623 [Tulasnella sp. 427]|nr:hypothetical protein FRB90_004623 [Tulasnella sp. 427]
MTYRIQNKDLSFTEEITLKGMTYKSGDYVHLMNPNDPSRPIIGQVIKLWIPDKYRTPGERGIAVCWYFRPEQTFHPPQRPFWEHEIFKTGHFADHAMEDIIEKVGCQFMTRHIRADQAGALPAAVQREEEDEMDMDMEGEEEEEDGQGGHRRKRMRSDSNQEARPIPPPTLLESLGVPYQPTSAST